MSGRFRAQAESRPVQVLRYSDWSGEVPGSASGLIRLVLTLRAAAKDDASPVIVQCPSVMPPLSLHNYTSVAAFFLRFIFHLILSFRFLFG